jgi:hypothetical protein
MRKTTISVSEAAHNFNEQVCLGRDLAAALAQADLSDPEAAAWRQDLQAARKTLEAPVDKWR